MFGERPLDDVVRALRAIATNQIAWAFPATYLSLTRETGRGLGESTAEEVADYFCGCVDDYLQKLQIGRGDAEAYLRGKHVLEYGPGDTCGVALLLAALGAESVTCVDRFPLMRLQPFSQRVLTAILARLSGHERARAESCFNTAGRVESGLSSHRIRYIVNKHGLSGERRRMSLILSRAVLEHVDALDPMFQDMRNAMTDDAIAIHLVDLRSHRLHRGNPLEFLTWPDWLWSLMYSAKGVPNRLRPDAYRTALGRAGLEIVAMEPTGFLPKEDVHEVRPYLARRFKGVNDEDLSCMGVWLTCRRGKSLGDA